MHSRRVTACTLGVCKLVLQRVDLLEHLALLLDAGLQHTRVFVGGVGEVLLQRGLQNRAQQLTSSECSSGLQIRISVNLNFELLNFKFELANLRTCELANLRTCELANWRTGELANFFELSNFTKFTVPFSSNFQKMLHFGKMCWDVFGCIELL